MATKSLSREAVQSIGSELRKYDEKDLVQTVITAIQQSPQFSMPQFQDRREFLNALQTENSTVHNDISSLIVHLANEYCRLYVEMRTLPVAERYMQFQVQWLQNIRLIVEHAESLAYSDAQEDALASELEPIASLVCSVALHGFTTTPIGNSLQLVVHTLARQVAFYMQSRILHMQDRMTESCDSDSCETADLELLEDESDDALYRLCGAQLHRMIKLRSDKVHGSKDRANKESSDDLFFLQQLVMNNDEKKIYLSPALLSTERGGRTFPKKAFLPFVREVVTMVKEDVNEDNFKKYGENLFKITASKLQYSHDLQMCFDSCCAEISVEETEDDTKERCIKELTSKLVNACKKNWDVTRQRHAELKGESTVTLNLRDKLKAYIAK